VTLEHWLSIATSGLCADAVARIRTEITDHYQTTIDSSSTPETALTSLGDPKKANRQYHRIYLTKKEAVVADVLASPKESLKRAIKGDFANLIVLGWLGSLGGFTPHLLLVTLFLLHTPWHAFYPPTTKERWSKHLWILMGRLLAAVLLVAYDDGPTLGLVVLGVLVLAVILSPEYWRWKLSRKLSHASDGVPVVSQSLATNLTPELTKPELTREEVLQTLTIIPRFRWMMLVTDILLFAAMMAYFYYANIGAKSLWTWAVAALLCMDLPFRWFFPPDTEERSRRYQRLGYLRWCAAMAHLLLSATLIVPWVLGGTVRWICDMLWILRRKFPAEEWLRQRYA
jgi:hypothetical protein